MMQVLKEHKTEFWGKEYTVKPDIAGSVIGDGKALLTIIPLATRPHYYCIWVDSSWKAMNQDELYLVIDKAFDLLEEEFGDHEGKPEDPLRLDCGYAWEFDEAEAS